MATSSRYVVPFRRKREGRTNYRKRLNLLKSGLPRLVIRRTNKYLIAQIVNYDPKGDKVLTTITSKALQKMGWKFSCKNLPAAYLLGLLIGKKAKELNVDKVILDIGLHRATKGNRLFAFVKGVLDSGINVPVDESMFPSDERLSGKHISEDVAKAFQELKNKIMK